MSARACCREMPKHRGNGFGGWQGNEAVRNRAGRGVYMETSADEVELNCFSKASHCGVSNQFLLYYMPHILIRINNLHDKQLNNYSSLYRVSLLKSMECRDAVTGKEIYTETGTGTLTPALPFPASSKRCTVNYSREISLSTGTDWFDFACSRLEGRMGGIGAIWEQQVLKPQLCTISELGFERSCWWFPVPCQRELVQEFSISSKLCWTLLHNSLFQLIPSSSSCLEQLVE